jgi:hypothetical protein
MPGNDQEQFEDYQELEQFIEEMRKGPVSPALRAAMARQSRIYSMVMLLRSASSEGTELRPEFTAALWARLEQELQYPSAGSQRAFRSQ